MVGGTGDCHNADSFTLLVPKHSRLHLEYFNVASKCAKKTATGFVCFSLYIRITTSIREILNPWESSLFNFKVDNVLVRLNIWGMLRDLVWIKGWGKGMKKRWEKGIGEEDSLAWIN